MSGPKGSGPGRDAASAFRSRAATCFLCRKEMQRGAMFNLKACNGLYEFLLKEGVLLSRPLGGGEEKEVCLLCLADLMRLQELLNKEKEIRRDMGQTAELIKGRVQESGQGEEMAGQDKEPEEDSEGEDFFELLSDSSEGEDRDVDVGGGAVLVGEAETPPNETESNVDGDASFSERSESSSSSSEEDDDDYRTSPRSKSKPRATATATKAGPGSRSRIRPETEKSPSYPCEVNGCKAILANKKTLYTHFLHAHNHRPFRCREPSCNAAFSYPAHLKGHMASTHENKGRRPFRCEVAGCGKRFSSSLYLQGHHYKVHSGKAVRTCGICGKKLSTSSYLKEHMKRIHSKK